MKHILHLSYLIQQQASNINDLSIPVYSMNAASNAIATQFCHKHDRFQGLHSSNLERHPGPHLLHFSLDFLDLPIHLRRNFLLFVILQSHEAFAQVAIDDSLHRDVV